MARLELTQDMQFCSRSCFMQNTKKLNHDTRSVFQGLYGVNNGKHFYNME